MTQSFSPARGATPCGRLRETFTEIRIRAGRERAHLRFLTNPGTLFATNPARTPSIAVSSPLSGVIAAATPPGSVLAARSLSEPQSARFWPLAIQQGQRWILNLRGGFKALRSLSFRTLFQSPEKPLSVARILFRENHRSLLSLHVPKHEAGAVGNAQNPFGEIQNVVR